MNEKQTKHYAKMAKQFQPKSNKPRENAKRFEVGGGWGDAIGWTRFPDSVHGWKDPMPVEGDILTCPMTSGKTGVWIFEKVKPCRDPEDMFFADVVGIGYSDEIDFPLPLD